MFSTSALIFSIFAGALAQLSLKAGLSVNTEVVNYQIIIGLFCYAASMATWVLALAKFELNFAYPLLSLGYVVVYIGAFYWPGIEETISWNKTIGLALVIAGVTVSVNGNKYHQVAREKLR